MIDKNTNLNSSVINGKIRVSTAIIYYDSVNAYYPYPYLQYETYIFSDDKRQKTKQIIHGTSGKNGSIFLEKKSKKIHKHISNNLKKRFETSPRNKETL